MRTLSSAGAPAGFANKNSSNQKILTRVLTLTQSLSSLFPLPIMPRALSLFSPLPRSLQHKRGLRGGKRIAVANGQDTPKFSVILFET